MKSTKCFMYIPLSTHMRRCNVLVVETDIIVSNEHPIIDYML